MTDPGSLGKDLLSDLEIAGWEPSVSLHGVQRLKQRAGKWMDEEGRLAGISDHTRLLCCQARQVCMGNRAAGGRGGGVDRGR